MDKIMPTNEEYIYDGRVVISQTDLKGIITFANKKFCEVSGYTIEELLGSAHNILRHPDIPKATFQQMWESISQGQTWNGIVKNLRKNGQYYWMDTEIIPIYNHNQEISGYISARRPASRKNIAENEALYKKMITKEKGN